MKYIIECKVPFVREVRIGIEADTAEDAIWIAQELMESSERLHLDNPIFPVLRDALEEADGSKVAYTVAEELPDRQPWPMSDHSVDAVRRQEEAAHAAMLLVKAMSSADPDQLLLSAAYAAALRATGRADGGTRSENRMAIITEGGAIRSIVAERPYAVRVVEVDYTRSTSDTKPPIVEHPVEESGLDLEELFNQAASSTLSKAV
jgi:hypothetical protein